MGQPAFIYCRISQDRTGGGLGVARQREDCEALAGQLGLTVAEVFVDNDISASKGKHRPSYEQMLARFNEVDAVLCWHIDRLTRRPSELERYISASEEHKVVTHAVTSGKVDLSSSSGRMTARVVGAVAAQESEQKAERVRRKALELVRAGRHMGGARPFGWNVVTTDDDRRQKRGGRYVLNELEAEALASAMHNVINGLSLGAIARQWNDSEREGGALPTVYGGRWGATQVRKTLLRPRNAGILEFGGEEVSRNAIPSVVPEATWRAVVSLMKNPSRRRGDTNKAVHLLGGIARCHCGRPVETGRVYGRVDKTTGKKHMHKVYRCQGHGKGHVAKRIEYVDAVVELYTWRALGAGLDSERAQTPESEARSAELSTELLALNINAEEFATAHAEGAVTLPQVIAHNKASDARRAAIEDELTELGAGTRPVLGPLADFTLQRKLMDERFRAWLALHVDDRRDWIRARFDITLFRHENGSPRDFDPDTVSVVPRGTAGRASITGANLDPRPMLRGFMDRRENELAVT